MATIPVKCLFCQQDCKFDHRDVMPQQYDVWKCNNCLHHAMMYLDANGHIGATMNAKIKEKYYCIDMWHPKCPLRVSAVSADGEYYGTLFTLNYTPDWNPGNIKEKLYSYLTFL